MSLTVISGWGPNCWAQYAHYFVETFERYWPAEVPLISYVETFVPECSRATLRGIRQCEGATEFIDRHRDVAERNGRAANRNWKEKHKIAGYNFRFDAVKFSRQAFIPYHAALNAETEYLAWFDADVVFTSRVDPAWIESMLPKDSHIAYIDRKNYHPDIGFQLYRLPQALPFLRAFREFYASDEVFTLPEWHSAHVWRAALWRSGVASINLTPNASSDAWPTSPLAKFSIHRKGPRKYKPWTINNAAA